jgi:hypothetical protein
MTALFCWWIDFNAVPFSDSIRNVDQNRKPCAAQSASITEISSGLTAACEDSRWPLSG